MTVFTEHFLAKVAIFCCFDVCSVRPPQICQVQAKISTVRPVLPDYPSASYDYDIINSNIKFSVILLHRLNFLCADLYIYLLSLSVFTTYTCYMTMIFYKNIAVIIYFSQMYQCSAFCIFLLKIHDFWRIFRYSCRIFFILKFLLSNGWVATPKSFQSNGNQRRFLWQHSSFSRSTYVITFRHFFFFQCEMWVIIVLKF